MIDDKATMAIWYRRDLIKIHLDNIYTDAHGFIITHDYQGGNAITLATRKKKECNTIKEGFQDLLGVNPEELSLVYDSDGFYFRGCRLKEDLRVIGLHVVGTIPFDCDSNVKFYKNNFSKYLFPRYYRNRKGNLCRFRVTDIERTNLAVKKFLDNFTPQLGYVNLTEKELYRDLLLSAGAVRSFDKGICQVATGEYVTQTFCKECGKLTGQCRASDDHNEIVGMRWNMDYCEKCALKLLDCTHCDNEYACDQSKTPSTCSEFTLCDYDYEDESACECPLNFEV